MSLAPATLRQRIEARITSVLGPGVGSPEWNVSALAYDAFPGGDLDDVQALSFAVGVPVTDFDSASRRQVGRQIAATTIVAVKFAKRLAADGHVGDYDTALGLEATLVAAVTGTTGDRGPAPAVFRVERGLHEADPALFVADVWFRVFHQYPM